MHVNIKRKVKTCSRI